MNIDEVIANVRAAGLEKEADAIAVYVAAMETRVREAQNRGVVFDAVMAEAEAGFDALSQQIAEGWQKVRE